VRLLALYPANPVFVGYVETEQKMLDASAVFEQMDPSETPRHADLR
jgi:hypothetical protein